MYTHACKTMNLAKYAVDTNLFQLESTNPKKNIQAMDALWWGARPPLNKKNCNFFFNVSLFLNKKKFQFIFSKVFKFA